ncbi:MAG TPA: universal stress protein [Mycobacterium sp.]|nr:universal stress protein [Mycobacterium sp.]
MIERILVAVDDTPDSLAAARLAIELTNALHAQLRVVHVSPDHVLDAALEAASRTPSVAVRRARAASAVLTWVTNQAAAAGIGADTQLLGGDAGPAVLDAAHQWHADLVIVGKSARAARGEPYVGTQSRHILEFSDQPVLVVPPPLAVPSG